MNQYSPRMTADQGGSELVYSRMDASTAREIADGWKYPPPYDFYDMTADPEDYQEFVTFALWPDFWFALFAFLSPYFLRSFIRESLVRNPAALSGAL